MNDTDKQVINNVVNELSDDAKLVADIFRAAKNKDRSALLALIPKAVQEVKEDVAAIKPAISVAKGYKTSEFILILVVAAFNAFSIYKTGNPLSIDFNATFAGLVGLYTLVRGSLKAKSTP